MSERRRPERPHCGVRLLRVEKAIRFNMIHIKPATVLQDAHKSAPDESRGRDTKVENETISQTQNRRAFMPELYLTRPVPKGSTCSPAEARVVREDAKVHAGSECCRVQCQRAQVFTTESDKCKQASGGWGRAEMAKFGLDRSIVESQDRGNCGFNQNSFYDHING